MQTPKPFTLSSVWVFLLFTFSSLTASAQLQQSNNIILTPAATEIKPPVTAPPKPVGEINLKTDTTDIFAKMQQLMDASKKAALKVIDEKRLNSSIELSDAQVNLQRLSSRPHKNLSTAEKKELERYKKEVDKQSKRLDSLSKVAADLNSNFQKKSAEAESQLLLKQLYRGEYYEKLLDIYRTNYSTIDSNYKIYENELKSKADSLAAGKWPLYATNKDSMVRELADIYGQLHDTTAAMRFHLYALGADYPDLEKKVKELEEFDVVRRLGAQSEEYIDQLFSTRKKGIVEAFAEEQKHNDAFKKKYEDYRAFFDKKLSEIRAIALKNKPAETKTIVGRIGVS